MRPGIELYDLSRWAQVPWDFLAALPFREAFLLSYLIREGQGSQDWFPAPTARIKRAIKGTWSSRRSIERGIAKLKRLGLISLRRGKTRNGGVQRLVRLGLASIAGLRRRAVHLQAVPEGMRPFCRIPTLSPPLKGGGGVYISYKIWRDPSPGFAQELQSIVGRVRKINSLSNPSTWAQSFRTLLRRGISHHRIRQVLTWYGRTLREMGDLIRRPDCFIPIAYSGPKWLEKWDRLEAAMERDYARRGESPPSYRDPKKPPAPRIIRNVSEEEHNAKYDEWGFER